ncbi:hypothetical protein GCM10011390_22840 [Aureimonas endophytica]|uniref:Uncharacterized protein n=1 Tax=Aureimonas endophytica TaxID=2027858 RepID=A0A916ZME4_9HYPH|nr:hypothetical protein [Aureimonas endophytica]GGE03397.1 hypothetical protein GCM10011390_22840 [Aureimonas endophytica]
MSNWDTMIDAARQGVLPSMFPADFELPMVAPVDLGKEAASLLRQAPEHTATSHTEGPERYTPRDVAHAFAAGLGHPVDVAVTHRAEWVDTFRKLGFSEKAACSFAGMTAATLDGGADKPFHAKQGQTSLADYIGNLIGRMEVN